MAKKKNLEWPNCSEADLRERVTEWARTAELSNAIIFLHGEMGAGKSTFARALLETLAPGQLSKGSPTFPLVQEYRALNGKAIYHIDLYRLKHEGELEDSGILAQVEEPGALAIVEWASMFPDTFAYWTGPPQAGRKRAKHVWSVEIAPVAGEPARRDFILTGPR